MLGRVADVWTTCGAAIDTGNQDVAFLKRTNRSLIGLMNEAVSLVRYVDEVDRVEGRDADWVTVEGCLNRKPYGGVELRPAG